MNKSAHIVRQSRQRVQTDSTRSGDHDRRVRRTQQALVQAFVALVREKSYDAITIQDLLDRADVGRSTFYAHYRGKDDLLQKSFERMLTMLDQHLDQESPANRVAPVRELFDHVRKFKSFHQALVRARVIDRQHQARVDHLSRLIERRLVARPPAPDEVSVPLPVLAQALAGALLALLTWWVEQDAPYTPELMDKMFHAIYNRNRS